MTIHMRYFFPKGVDWSLKKKELSFRHGKRTYKFSNKDILFTLVSLIGKKKLVQPIFLKPNLIVGKLIQLGLVQVQLVSNGSVILEMNYLPKLTKKSKSNLAKINRAELMMEISKKSVMLKDASFNKNLLFLDKNDFFIAIGGKKNECSEVHQVIRQILSASEFTPSKISHPGWEKHDFVFHNQTGISNPNFYPERKKTPKAVGQIEIELDKQTKTIVTRRSHRDFSDKPVSFNKLSRLFWNIGRKTSSNHRFFGKHYRGTYPSAGGAYENEFYLLAGNCENLEQGLYRYDGFSHKLLKLDISRGDFLSLKTEAESKVEYRGGAAANAVIVTSKIGLLKKKYSKVAYRLALLNAGVIIGYLDFYTNKLKLGGCPAGSIDWKTFGQIVNVDGYKEFAVAEYLLGEIKSHVEPRKY